MVDRLDGSVSQTVVLARRDAPARGDGPLMRAADEAIARERPGLLRDLFDPETVRAVSLYVKERIAENAAAKKPRKIELVAKVTAEVANKRSSGEWRLAKTKDGEVLADLIDRKGKYRRKLRLEEREVPQGPVAPRQSAGDALGHAVTHALLRQIAAKLDVIDRKLDDVLTNQKFEWWEDIHSAVWSLEVARARGVTSLDDPQVAVALQSLRKGGGVGRRHVDRTAERLAKLRDASTWERAKSLGSFQTPKAEVDALLAELETDLGHMMLAAEVLASWLVRCGLGQVALDECRRLDETVASLGERIDSVHRLSGYDAKRDVFWEETLRSFRGRRTPDKLILEIPIGEDEVRLLAAELED